MDDEARKKLFEMHGTLQRLDQKTDNMLQTQGELQAQVNRLDDDIDTVDNKTQKNRKKIHVVYVVSGVLATLAGIASNALPTLLK